MARWRGDIRTASRERDQLGGVVDGGLLAAGDELRLAHELARFEALPDEP